MKIKHLIYIFIYNVGKVLVYQHFADFANISDYSDFILYFILFVIIMLLFQEFMTIISTDKAT